jgi:hypothetical protein
LKGKDPIREVANYPTQAKTGLEWGTEGCPDGFALLPKSYQADSSSPCSFIGAQGLKPDWWSGCGGTTKSRALIRALFSDYEDKDGEFDGKQRRLLS